jgi:hypothetical protein
MTRAPVRSALTIAFIAASLCLIARSPAAARPPHAVQETAPAGWVATWTTAVERLFLGTPPAAHETHTAPLRPYAAAETSMPLPMPMAHPLTGSCVDPNGCCPPLCGLPPAG